MHDVLLIQMTNALRALVQPQYRYHATGRRILSETPSPPALVMPKRNSHHAAASQLLRIPVGDD